MATHASRATQASRDLDKVKKQKSDRLKAALVQAEDTLKPDAEEEAVHILIDDDFAFTTQDVVALVRLRQPTNTGLEEHVDIDELEADSSPLNSPPRGSSALSLPSPLHSCPLLSPLLPPLLHRPTRV